MTVEPRSALARLVNALERHLEVASRGRGDDDPAVQKAADELADAFETYDDALYEKYDTSTPFFVPADDEDDDFDEEDDDDASDGPEMGDDEFDEDDEDGYLGFGDDDIEFDEDEEE